MLWPLFSKLFNIILTDHCLSIDLHFFTCKQSRARCHHLSQLSQSSAITRDLWRFVALVLTQGRSAHFQEVEVVRLRGMLLLVARVWRLLWLLGLLGYLLVLAEDVHAGYSPFVGLVSDRDWDVCYLPFYQFLFQHLRWVGLWND